MRRLIFPSLLLAAAASAAAAWAQQASTGGGVHAEPPTVGGFAPANESDADQKAARKMAIDAIAKKRPAAGDVQSVTARVQVVAGLNYAFHVVMKGGAAFDVVVYRNLQGDMSVTKLAEATP